MDYGIESGFNIAAENFSLHFARKSIELFTVSWTFSSFIAVSIVTLSSLYMDL